MMKVWYFKPGEVMLRLIAAVFIYLVFGSCSAQTDNSLIQNWKSYPIPTDKDSLQKYNWSQNNWAVSVKNNNISVQNTRDIKPSPILPFKIKFNKNDGNKMRGQISILTVEDGYLIGFFAGEWGGSLYWFSKNGKKNYQISDDEIVQFIRKDETNYAIQGLSHLSISEGTVIKIEKSDGKWRSKEYLKLPEAPDAISLDSNKNFIVITSNSLLKIENNCVVSTLISNGIWRNGLYPNSLIIKNDILYAGMRAGVFKYNIKTGEQNWLLPY